MKSLTIVAKLIYNIQTVAHIQQSTGAFLEILLTIIIIIIVRLAPFQCIAPLAANNLQCGLSSASASVALRMALYKCDYYYYYYYLLR